MQPVIILGLLPLLEQCLGMKVIQTLVFLANLPNLWKVFVTQYNFTISGGGVDSETDYNGITFKVGFAMKKSQCS